jgi:hypothetical protein
MNRERGNGEVELLSLIQKCSLKMAELKDRLQEQESLKAVFEAQLLAIRCKDISMSRIPNDILHSIFLDLVRGESIAIAPILLVCRRWHDIAVNSPLLWCNLCITFPVDIHQIDRIDNYIKMAFIYSQITPMHISITIPSDNELWEDMARKINMIPTYHTKEWIESMKDCSSDDNYLLILADYLRKAHRYPLTPQAAAFDFIDQGIDNQMQLLSNHIAEAGFQVSSIKLKFRINTFDLWKRQDFFSGFAGTTPNLEELIVDTDDLGGGDDFSPAGPIPSLTRVSWHSASRVERLLVPNGKLTHFEQWVTFDFRFWRTILPKVYHISSFIFPSGI